jgi:hypothetical protein
MKMKDEEAVMKKLGLDFELLDSGCCGMAGSFGFEKGHGRYEVSIKCGERVLLPAVRKAPRDSLIISNGFSCREQISQTTRRKALHLADVIKMALNGEKHGEKYLRRVNREFFPRWSGLFGLAVLGLGTLLAYKNRRTNDVQAKVV